MAHSYSSQYPVKVAVDEGIIAFFEEFYKTSDTPDAHDKYADSFTGGATLIMASKKAVGREGKFYLFAFVARFCSMFSLESFATLVLRDSEMCGQVVLLRRA
jgi:hypothetical protein